MGAVCDPCGKAGRAVLLPPEFFTAASVRAALAVYDFGVFFRQVRRYQNWSQRRLGEVLDMPQGKISAIEHGRAVTDIRVVVTIHERLGVPAALLGFTDRATVGHTGIIGWKGGSWMDRRDFVSSTAALTFGAVGAAGLDVERLVALLYPDADATGLTRIGAADVAALEHATREYERSNATYGGAIAREAAAAQLRAVLPLLAVPMDDAVRPRLYIAATHLAMRAGWLEFDVAHHDAARRLWTVGLEIARCIEHPLTTDLTGHILVMLADQSLHLRRPDEASKFVQLGHAVGGRHPVSPSTTTALATKAACAHAARGQVTECQRALGEAEDAFTLIDPAATTPWACGVGSLVRFSTWQGHAYYELARRGGDPRLRDQAVTLLSQVLDNPRPVTRAQYLPDLAGARALVGDVDTAVVLGHQAVDTITAMSSRRNYARLGVLHGVLEPMRESPGVGELRGRLATATTA